MKQPSGHASRQTLDSAEIDPISDTVEAIVSLHSKVEGNVSTHQRLIERWTAWVGRPFFFYFILILSIVWIVGNTLGLMTHGRVFDAPPFPWLQGFASVGSFLVAITVLIVQNRQARLSERRGQIDLQINLLSEAKITKLISLLEELRRDIPSVQNRHDPEAERMQESTDPHAIAAALETKLETEGLITREDAILPVDDE